MKIQHSNRGYAMILTLAFIAITLIGVASLMMWASSNAKQTGRNNQFVASQYAAEAAVENVISHMSRDFSAQSMTNAAYYVSLVPTNFTGSWPVQYTFSDPVSNVVNQTYVYIGPTETNLTPLPPPYTGLKSFAQQCEVVSTATPVGQLYNVPATVREKFTAASIPLFQFLIFYNAVDLEFNAAFQVSADGPVFSNEGFWGGSDNITFNSTVWAVNQTVSGPANDPFGNYPGPGRNSTSPHYNFPGQPVSGVKPLIVPVAGATTNNSPAVVETLLQWPPPAFAFGTPAAYSSNGLTYFANAADLVISNAAGGVSSITPTGTNFTVFYQDSARVNPLMPVNYDFYIVTNANLHFIYFTNYIETNVLGPNTNVLYAGYTFLTNALFGDWREGWNRGNQKKVQSIDFDIAGFYAWLANTNLNGTTNLNGGKFYNDLCSHKSHPINGIYIYNYVPLSLTTLPAVRVKNGRRLYDRYGLSVATPMPLYVWGDYNVADSTGSNAGQNSTTHTEPAALFADAITILSGEWDDSDSAQKPSTSTTTTVNAACMAGVVPSNKNILGGGDDSSYSGGVENFFRLLENWNGGTTPFYYNGSIVVMFPSQYATNRWRQTGNFYGAPKRHWAFDTNFLMQDHLPPMAPQIKTLVHNSWATQ
jgi:hypothetical protein